MIKFSAKGNLQKVNLNLETVASNFDHDEQKQGLLYGSVYSSQLIAPNKAGWSSNQFKFKIQISLMKKYYYIWWMYKNGWNKKTSWSDRTDKLSFSIYWKD